MCALCMLYSGVTTEGGDQSDVLMEAVVPVIEQEKCNQQYDNKITARMICGSYEQGGTDACQGSFFYLRRYQKLSKKQIKVLQNFLKLGDSGGPYQKEVDGRWTEIGVVCISID